MDSVRAAFKAYLLARGLAVSTAVSYLGGLSSFIEWYREMSGEFDLAAVTQLDIADYRRHLLAQGKKPATVNHALDVLRSFFSWAVRQGLVQVNSAEDVKGVPGEKKAPRWLDRKSLAAIVRAVQRYGKPRDRALIALLIHSGLRVSEACGLKVADVTILERSGNVLVRRGKGERWREVPLNVTIRKILSDYLEVHPGGEWLFLSRRGRRLSTRAAERVVKKYATMAGIGATPHQLRHTFCKGLVDAGVTLDKVAVLAGHSNLNTTARYVRPSVQDLEKAVERLAWE